MRYISFGLFLWILLALNIFAQMNHCDQAAGYVLDKEKPSVYIEFEQFGKADDWQNSKLAEKSKKPEIKKGDDVWLRLYNNSCWDIQFRTLSAYMRLVPDPSNPGKVNLASDILDGTAANVSYVSKERDGKFVPWGGDSFSMSYLPSGRSLVFPVYRTHLVKGRSVYMEFTYGWETKQFSNNLAPEHRAFFWGYRLEQEREK
jgi:hypothetical protein